MKVDFSQKILNIDNEEIKEPGTDKPLTLDLVAATALQNNYQGEEITPNQKLERFLLAMKVYKQDIVDVSLDEIDKIKKVVDKCYGTLVYARVHMLFEDAAKSPVNESKS